MPATITPWGVAHTERELFPGAMIYTTGSHGGIHLSPERLAEFKATFPDFPTFCGSEGWFEEDCDAAAVILAFAEHFDDEHVRSCVKGAECFARPFNLARKGDTPSIQRYPKWERVVEWLERSPAGRQCVDRSVAFEDSRAGMFERGSWGSIPFQDLCWVSMSPVKGGASVRCLMTIDEIYSKRHFTAAEVDSASRRELPKQREPELVGSAIRGRDSYYDEGPSDADPGL